MKILRKFSITPSRTLEEQEAMTYGKEYPVIAIDEVDDEVLALVADDDNELIWVELRYCFLHSIDGKPGFGVAYDVSTADDEED